MGKMRPLLKRFFLTNLINMNTLDKTPEEPIRIFLANQPRMIRQMLRRAIQHVPNLNVVGEATRLQSVLSVPRIMSIDWLVVSLNENGNIPSPFLKLSEKYPSIRVLGLSLDGNELTVKDNDTGGERTLRDVSLKGLIALFQEKYSKQTTNS